ncbi:hypothetical protein BARRETLEMON_51 [Arthrobacter phage BarretLemon]|uniref:Uncharacterized protein n=2 Tax=Marthavirus barretlemon TaxID=2560300 RepID=A0A386KMA9_9CAUD|nr:hypothetical protein BJD79_gp51 [Arthrobacter phage BarretLemon]AMM44513.1 hypothetical protein BARRETLEMON_51 [Arthrobacter phage BarretLemon]AYD86522.1 hypothetical protein SEA_LEEROYJ_51 [Arthrobacter phage LeeroyJ]
MKMSLNIEIKVSKLEEKRAIVHFKGGEGVLLTLDRQTARRMASAAVARAQDDVIGNSKPWLIEKYEIANPEAIRVVLKLVVK